MVIVVEQQTWVTLLGFAGFGLTLMTYLTAMKRDLKAEIANFRTELKTDIANTRTDLKTDIANTRTELKTEIRTMHSNLKTDIGRLDGRLVALESRVHDIAVRLPAAMAPAKPTAS